MAADKPILEISNYGLSLVRVQGDGVLTPLNTLTPPTYKQGGLYYDRNLHKMVQGGATAWETMDSLWIASGSDATLIPTGTAKVPSIGAALDMGYLVVGDMRATVTADTDGKLYGDPSYKQIIATLDDDWSIALVSGYGNYVGVLELNYQDTSLYLQTARVLFTTSVAGQVITVEHDTGGLVYNAGVDAHLDVYIEAGELTLLNRLGLTIKVSAYLRVSQL
jgi:hypothetical protein